MNATAGSANQRDSLWRRWMLWLVRIDEAMTITYDEVQDQRMDRIEADLSALRQRLAASPFLEAVPANEMKAVGSRDVEHDTDAL